jgi:ribosomal protein S12 methylthiotransferase accessory factor
MAAVESARKSFTIGTDRIVGPEETLSRVRPFYDELGITRVANITGLDRLGVPVVAVCRPNARSLSVSMGKGATLAAAKASGVMESIENHHAESIEAPLFFGSHDELAERHQLVDLSRLARLSVAGELSRERRLWLEARNLDDGARRLVPFEVVSTDYRVPLPPGRGALVMSSNGLASGNHLLEATSHGICELVERDSLTLWQFSSAAAKVTTRLDLHSVDDPVCGELLESLDRASLDVMVWETTSDVGIPAFRCELADRPGSSFHAAPVVAAAGCHPRREIALSRALTEAAQGRLTLISGARDDIGQHWYDENHVRLELQEFRHRFRDQAPPRSFSAGLTWSATSLDDDVAWELDRLRAVGLDEVLVVDLTKERYGIPVVRVVIPGLESIHEIAGFSPGARARAVIAGASK